MGGKTHSNVAEASKAEVGEIDTRAPFASVKAALSLFGVAAILPEKPVIKKSKPVPTENTLVKETELHLAQKELNKLKEQLDNAETTRVQALAELEKTKRAVEDLTNKLKIINESKESAIRAAETAKIQIKQCEEAKSSSKSENDLSWKLELDDAREQYAVLVTELDATKQELRQVKKDFETSMDAKVSAFQQEAEAKKLADANMEKTAQLSTELTAVQESLADVKLAFLRAQQEESKILAEKDASQQAYVHALEEAEKKLVSLKKEFDPELGNLEVKLAETEVDIGALQKELENAKLSNLDSVTSLATELDGAKEVLQKVVEEDSSLRSLVESLRLELENMRKEHLELKEEETKTESIVANLQNKLQEEKAGLDIANTKELKATASCEELILAIESEKTRKEAESTRNSAEELRKDAKAAQLALDEAEKKLEVALREAEDAKAAEANALSQIKVISEKANAAQSSTSESGANITISAEEHKSLSRTVKESETVAEMKMAAALAQVETVRANENEAIKRLEATLKVIEEVKSATEEALKRAEMAEAARTAVEGEMKRWREKEQKLTAEAASLVSSETQTTEATSPRSSEPKANAPEKNEEVLKSEKATANKKALRPQFSGIFQRKRNQVDGESPSYLAGEKPV